MRALTLRGIALRRSCDDEVLSRAVGGEEVAFAELYRRFSKPIYGLCLARLMSVQAAEDATQEVFMRVLRSERRDIENPRAWLFAIARNVCTDVARELSRVADGETVEDHLHPAADTADELLRRQDARSIMLALRRLPARYRSALILREMHGLSSAEMGEALGATPGAVDTIVSRARDAFGVKYAEVKSLDGECSRAVEAIYRDLGTGIDESDRSWLGSHMKTCPSCKAEFRRARSKRHLAALLPLLLTKAPTLSLLPGAARLAEAGTGPAGFFAQHGPKVAALALSTVLVAVPATKVAVDRVRSDPGSPTRTALPRALPIASGGAAGAAKVSLASDSAKASRGRNRTGSGDHSPDDSSWRQSGSMTTRLLTAACSRRMRSIPSDHGDSAYESERWASSASGGGSWERSSSGYSESKGSSSWTSTSSDWGGGRSGSGSSSSSGSKGDCSSGGSGSR